MTHLCDIIYTNIKLFDKEVINQTDLFILVSNSPVLILDIKTNKSNKLNNLKIKKMSDHGRPSNHVEEKISTPDVKKSQQVKVLIVVFLSVVLFLAIIIIWLNIKSDKDTKDELPKHAESEYNATYDMLNVEYGQILTFDVSPGEKILVELTNDWCPMWSNNQITVYDSFNNKRVLLKDVFIKGLATSNATNAKFIFCNTSHNMVTVKIGHCESKNNCNINL